MDEEEEMSCLIKLYSNKVVENLAIYGNTTFIHLRAEDKDVNNSLFTCLFNNEGQWTSFIETYQ